MIEGLELALASTEESAEIHAWLRRELRAFNEKFLGPHEARPILSVAKLDGQVVGAVGGVVILDWLSVEIVFLREDLRGQGLGAQLLRQLED